MKGVTMSYDDSKVTWIRFAGNLKQYGVGMVDEKYFLIKDYSDDSIYPVITDDGLVDEFIRSLKEYDEAFLEIATDYGEFKRSVFSDPSKTIRYLSSYIDEVKQFDFSQDIRSIFFWCTNVDADEFYKVLDGFENAKQEGVELLYTCFSNNGSDKRCHVLTIA